MLIHDDVKKRLDEMAQRFFWMNKKLDRIKSVMNTKFAMPLLSNKIHIDLAHSYPILADKINDIEEMFNFDAMYYGVDGALEQYESVDQMIGQIYEWTLETNDMLCATAIYAKEHGDFVVYKLMSPLIVEYAKYVENAILLVDKKELYGENLHDMDDNCEKWWKL